jgi:hypothetical protein
MAETADLPEATFAMLGTSTQKLLEACRCTIKESVSPDLSLVKRDEIKREDE